MELGQIFRSDSEFPYPKVGEVQMVDGKRSMCVCSCASYGGGSGPLWATEQEIALITVVGFRYPGYIEVWCDSVDPIKKTIDIRVTKGPTWGPLRQGARVRIGADQIGRYENRPGSRPDFVEECRDLELVIQARQAFVDITRVELEREFVRAQSVELGKLIGEPEAQRCHQLIKDYLALLRLVDQNGGLFLREPNKRTRSLARRIKAAVSGDPISTEVVAKKASAAGAASTRKNLDD